MRTLVVTPTYLEAENIDEFLERARARRSRRRHPRRRRQQPRRHRRPRREGRAPSWADRRAAPPDEDRASATPTAPGSRSGSSGLRRRSSRSTPTSRTTRPPCPACSQRGRGRRRPRHRLALRARRRDPALAVVPPGAVEVGQPLRVVRARHADQATRPPGTASTAPTRSRRSTTPRTRAKGYGFQIELAYRVLAVGRPHRRAPDRVHRPCARPLEDDVAHRGRGAALVTWWGVRDRVHELRS